MVEELLATLWFFLPAGVGNASASLSRFLPLLHQPLDFGKSYRGHPIFGANKTWRGLLVGTMLAALVASLQVRYADDFPPWLTQYLPDIMVPAFTGVLLGSSALIGDAVESFFKRQRGIPSGTSWMPFDQLDWILAAAICSLPLQTFPRYYTLIAIAIYGGLHVLANRGAHWIGLQKNKY